jgi:hypothetical protein
LAAVASCWGDPRLSVTGASTRSGAQFWFGYCRGERPPPALFSITVSETDSTGRALDPPTCRLIPRDNLAPRRVAEWLYGTDLPTLVIARCAPLRPNHRYRIDIGGGGDGTTLFLTDGNGRLQSIEKSCR